MLSPEWAILPDFRTFGLRSDRPLAPWGCSDDRKANPLTTELLRWVKEITEINYQLILNAIKDGNEAEVELLAKRVNFNQGPALLNASEAGHEKLVKILLRNGAKDDKAIALLAAARTGHEKVVQELVDYSTEVDKNHALLSAAKEGHEKVVRVLLENDNATRAAQDRTTLEYSTISHQSHVQETPIKEIDKYGAIIAASENGHEMVVETIMEYDVHEDFTLSKFTEDGHEKLALMSLKKGFSIEDKTRALNLASQKGYEKLARALRDAIIEIDKRAAFNRDHDLSKASFNGDEEAVRRLLQEGANVNFQSGYYGSVLQAATSEGQEKVVQLLLDRGADVDPLGLFYNTTAGSSREENNVTPLYAASCMGYEKIVSSLIGKGANVNAEMGRHGTALQAASCGGHVNVAQKLLDAGADVNARIGRHGSALEAACAKGHTKAVELLLDNGADVTKGYYLSFASERGHEEVVRVLLSKGATKGLDDALKDASKNGHEKVAKMLVDYGAKYQ